MRIGAFEIQEPLPELQEPHVLAILRPWVNVGRVGTQVLSQLERHFASRGLGELVRPGQFLDFTRYRPRSRMVAGRREMTIPNSTISYAQREEGPDFLFFNLREPHAFGEDYVDSIVEILKTFGVKRYCLIGGMYDIVPHTRPLLVSGAMGGRGAVEEAKRVGIQESSYQGPTSITSLITQEALKLGIDHMTFVVHLPQYVQLEEDYAGAARLMGLLSTIYQFPPHLIDEERGQRQYQDLNAAVERNPELKGVLQQLESQYDAKQGPPQEPPPPPLSPEVERFLQELDQKEDEG
jgi:predicted ATP-grasp superfamily ATP-dependent carboligase